MKRERFDYICQICAPFLQKQDTRFRETIPLHKRDAVALNWLAHGWSQQSAGAPFRIARSTSQEIISKFIDEMFAMRNDFIKFPVTLEDCKRVVKTLEGKTLLPNVIGAIDGMLVENTATQCNRSNRRYAGINTATQCNTSTRRYASRKHCYPM